MRTIIEIPKEQLQDLTCICNNQNISRAEAIRRAISMYVAEEVLAANDDAFGIWKNRSIDSIEYQKTMRVEWE